MYRILIKVQESDQISNFVKSNDKFIIIVFSLIALPGKQKSKIILSMAIENMELMHKCCE